MTEASSAQSLSVSSSRYASEYDELGQLGFGGFGSVFRVRARLDGHLYAVKKVVLPPNASPLPARERKEVQLLARISNHPHIVRYFSSWVERVLRADVMCDEDDESGLGESWSMISLASSDSIGGTARGLFFLDEHSSESGGDDDGSKAPVVEARVGGEEVDVLFVQMELCSDLTLREWLDDPDRSVDREVNLRILSQLLAALQHVHAFNVVHRDIKPANVFLESNTVVKLGDFGLATSIFEQCGVPPPAEASSAGGGEAASMGLLRIPSAAAPGGVLGTARSIPSDVSEAGNLTQGLGSTLYAAPEQVDGDGRYGTGADMFSVGLVMVEMFLPPFTTMMERVRTLEAARAGHLDPQIYSAYPQVADLIASLLVVDSERPTAAALLRHPVFEPVWVGSATGSDMASYSPTSWHWGTPPASPMGGSKAGRARAHSGFDGPWELSAEGGDDPGSSPARGASPLLRVAPPPSPSGSPPFALTPPPCHGCSQRETGMEKLSTKLQASEARVAQLEAYIRSLGAVPPLAPAPSSLPRTWS